MPTIRRKDFKYTENGETKAYFVHTKKMLVTGEYIIILTDAFPWNDWHLELAKNRFLLMSQPVVYVCGKEIDRKPNVFARNNADMAITWKHSGVQPRDLKPTFSGM